MQYTARLPFIPSPRSLAAPVAALAVGAAVATGAWALPELFALWQSHGIDAVREAMAVVPEGFAGVGEGDRRRVLVHSSGFQMSPYSDIRPAGEETKGVARKLWHRSPGSAG